MRHVPLFYVHTHYLISFQLMVAIGTTWFAADTAEAWIYTDDK